MSSELPSDSIASCHNCQQNCFTLCSLHREWSIESNPSQFSKDWDKGKLSFKESDHWWALAHRFLFSVFCWHDAQTITIRQDGNITSSISKAATDLKSGWFFCKSHQELSPASYVRNWCEHYAQSQCSRLDGGWVTQSRPSFGKNWVQHTEWGTDIMEGRSDRQKPGPENTSL